jgi:hypothetical protein
MRKKLRFVRKLLCVIDSFRREAHMPYAKGGHSPALYAPVAQAGCRAASDHDLEEDVDDQEAIPSTCFLMAINAFAFAYSLVCCTLGVIVLPSEAVHLFRDQHAMMLGVMLGCTGITQLLSPAVGYLSDRSLSPYGRRRPLMVLGGVVACVGNVAMLATRELRLRYMFIAALTIAISGLNIRCAHRQSCVPLITLHSSLTRAHTAAD